MQPVDPLRILFRFYSLLNRVGRVLVSPFGWIQSLILYLRKVSRRTIRIENAGDWSPIRKARHFFYRLASSPKRWMQTNAVRRTQRMYPVRALRRALGLTFRASLVEPFKWFVQISGLVFAWAKSRKWPSVVAYSLPLGMLFVVAVLAWRGGRIDRTELAERYIQWGELELGSFEETIQYSRLRANPTELDTVSNSQPSEIGETGIRDGYRAGKEVSEFGELLFRRAHLLQPRDQSYFIIGLRLLQRGAEADARRFLSKIAPDDQIKDFRAHGIMAVILLEELARTSDESLIPVFQHHAAAGAKWLYMSAEVMAVSAEFYWFAGNQELALDRLKVAAELQPEFFLLYYDRAAEAGLAPLADAVRARGITRMQRLLKQNPRDNYMRAHLAALESTQDEGLERAEALLQEGNLLNPSPILSRALSEVYLKKFNQALQGGLAKPEVISMVDKAMAADPSNPKVAETIASLMQAEIQKQSTDQIIHELNRTLVAGNATTGTHAMLAEYNMQRNQRAQALIHLDQVYRISPTAAKYSYMLCRLHLEDGRLEEALSVANRALSLISQRNLLAERYVDDLLDTLGRIYQEQENWAEALPLYELCLSLSPDRPATRLRLAQVYRASGKEDAALAQEAQAKSSEQLVHKRENFIRSLTAPIDMLKRPMNSTSSQAEGNAVHTEGEPDLGQNNDSHQTIESPAGNSMIPVL